MSPTRTTDQLIRKAKGKTLEVRGRATGDRRTELRGWLTRTGAKPWSAARGFGRRLRSAAHR